MFPCECNYEAGISMGSFFSLTLSNQTKINPRSIRKQMDRNRNFKVSMLMVKVRSIFERQLSLAMTFMRFVVVKIIVMWKNTILEHLLS